MNITIKQETPNPDENKYPINYSLPAIPTTPRDVASMEAFPRIDTNSPVSRELAEIFNIKTEEFDVDAAVKKLGNQFQSPPLNEPQVEDKQSNDKPKQLDSSSRPVAKRYACDQCTFKFNQKGDLIRHKLKHTGKGKKKLHLAGNKHHNIIITEISQRSNRNIHMPPSQNTATHAQGSASQHFFENTGHLQNESLHQSGNTHAQSEADQHHHPNNPNIVAPSPIKKNDADKHFLLSLLPDYEVLNGDDKLDFRLLTLQFFRNIRHSRNSQIQPPPPTAHSFHYESRQPSMQELFFPMQQSIPVQSLIQQSMRPPSWTGPRIQTVISENFNQM